MARMRVGPGDILDQAIDWLRTGRSVAVATVIKSRGSTPCPIGSQLAVNDQGAFVGSVSGGCVEATTIRTALDVIASGKSCRVEFGAVDTEGLDVGLACGGRIEIMLQSLQQDVALLEQLRRHRDNRHSAVLATEIATGRQMVVALAGDDRSEGADPGLYNAARRAAEEDRSTLLMHDGAEWFLLVRNPSPRLIIVGAVHIAQALAPMAALNGFDVVVIDPREPFATQARFAEVALTTNWPDAALRELAPDARTAVVTLTHDAKIDDVALAVALASAAFYIGALGSQRTHRARLGRLAERGFRGDELARIHGPVGLDIARVRAGRGSERSFSRLVVRRAWAPRISSSLPSKESRS